MLICVDGTGKRDTAEYFTKMQNSFVLQIYGMSIVPGRRYYRGPDAAGLPYSAGGKQIPPAAVVAEIAQMWSLGDHKLFMTGFSRGGATVIDTAALLQQQRKDIEIEAMFLFDAVDRSVALSKTKSIPSNVKKCYHAIRAEYGYFTWDDVASRESFGHCGLDAQGDPTTLIKRAFVTTHGGMGGCCFGEREGIPGLQPIKPNASPAERSARAEFLAQTPIRDGFPDFKTRLTVAEEAMGCREVADWMSERLVKHQVCSQSLVAVTVSPRDKAHPEGIPHIIPAPRSP